MKNKKVKIISKFLETEFEKLMFTKRDSSMDEKLKQITDRTLHLCIDIGVFTTDYYKATTNRPLPIPNVNYSCEYEDDASKPFFADSA